MARESFTGALSSSLPSTASSPSLTIGIATRHSANDTVKSSLRHSHSTPRHMTASNTSGDSRSASLYEEIASLHELTSERRAVLIDFIDKSVDDAYNLCHGFGRIRWSPSKNREGVSICRARADDEGRLDAAVRGKCNVNATFEEMMDTLITETTEDFCAHESSVNPSEFLDGQVLYTLVPRTPEDRFVCVKWHCIKSLAPSVAKHRDYLYVEVVDQFEDRDGKKIGYRLSKSVELEELASGDTSHLFVRGKTLTFHTFSALATGNLEFYTMMINDLGERLPTWLIHKIVDTAALRCACIRDHINQKRLDLLIMAKPSDMVPLSKRVCCIVCTKSFSLVRKKYNCVACGEVICNHCSVHQLVAAQGISEQVGKRKARICVKCSTLAKKREIPRRTSIRQSDSETSGRFSTDKHSDTDSARSLRSASTADTSSIGSTNSNEDPAARVYPTNANRSSIPHMFQFRPAVTAKSNPNQTSRSLDESTMGRSSELIDLANLIDEEAIASRATSGRLTTSRDLDLGVGKYKALYAQIQSEIGVQTTDVPSLRHSKSFGPMRSSMSTATELFIEELIPSTSARTSISAEEPEVTIVKPVVVRKVTRRSSTGRRKSIRQDETSEKPPVDQANPANAASETIQLADLKMHLDRMTQISESLRNLKIMETHQPTASSSSSSSSAMATLVDFEKKAKEVATENKENDELEEPQSQRKTITDSEDLETDAEEEDEEVEQVEIEEVDEEMRFRLTSEDGNFSGFLTDSSFVDMGEVAENAPAGWKAVHSKTTGKIYYYNESCGTTSWTLPASDAAATHPKEAAAYMVL